MAVQGTVSALYHKKAQKERGSFFQNLIQVVQDPLFIAGPQRSYQIPLGSVPGDPVDHHIRRHLRKTCFQPRGIRWKLQTPEFPGQVVFFQIGTPQDIEAGGI